MEARTVVPLEGRSLAVSDLRAQKLVHGVHHRTIHLHLGHHWEANAILVGKAADLRRGTGLLVGELVAGKCDNLKSTRRKTCMQLNELCVRLVR